MPVLREHVAKTVSIEYGTSCRKPDAAPAGLFLSHLEMFHASSLGKRSDQSADRATGRRLIVGGVGIHVLPVDQQQKLGGVLYTPSEAHGQHTRHGRQ
jgi:hypothetical protein